MIASSHRRQWVGLFVISVLALLALVPGRLLPATGQTLPFGPPGNDNFANASVIAVLPFSDVVNTTGATTEPGEPQPFQCSFQSQTVWYAFTATQTALVRADNLGTTSFATELTVYKATGQGIGGLSLVGCAFNSAVAFTAQVGTTYYLQTSIGFGPTGDLHTNLHAVLPPANDNFTNATPVGVVPYSNTVDMTAATLEPGEPTACGGNPTASAWYAFSPSSSGSVTASDSSITQSVAAYSGASLTTLINLGCGTVFGLTLHVNAGQTYYFQVTNAPFPGAPTSITFSLAVPAPPQASFFYSPGDPSIFDTVQFGDTSFDPAQAGFQSEAWSLGDGATATGSFPTHRFTADGDYTTKLTVTTTDGRTATATQIIHVKTHDVRITRFVVPQAARAGHTREIEVHISDSRYPETVQVQLLKGTASGFQEVGTLTEAVPVTPSKHTITFTFSYTFTNDDALVGNVTFEAIATISGARDAVPTDNTVIAVSTTVH